MAVRERRIQSRKIAGNCEKLRCGHQTPRSLQEHNFCTEDARGTNAHARGTGKRGIAGKLWELADLIPPPEGCIRRGGGVRRGRGGGGLAGTPLLPGSP